MNSFTENTNRQEREKKLSQGCAVEGRLSKQEARKEKKLPRRCECDHEAKEWYETILFAPKA
jgi:hypothetical protein